MDFINHIIIMIEQFSFLGYGAVLVMSFLESLAFIGLIVPGTIFVVAIGFASASGFWRIEYLILFAAIGAIAGDILSYYLGSNAENFLNKDSRILKSKYLKKGNIFFDNYGGGSIFLGRFIGYLRPFIPFIAGMLKMNKRRFLFWNILSGFIWATAYLFAGFFFGQAWEVIVLWSKRGSIAVAILVIFIIVVYLLERLIIRSGRRLWFLSISIGRSVKDAITSNVDVQKIVKKHNKLFDFIGTRLDKKHFSGLPLTLLAASFVYVLFLFFGIVEDIVKADVIINMDTRIMNLLYAFRNQEMVKVFLWITLLGKWQVIIGFMSLAVTGMWIWGKRLYIIPFLVAIFGSASFTALSKILFQRPRPDLAVQMESSFSFPSGHATIAVAFYGFMTYLLVRIVKRWRLKVKMFFIGFIVIIIIGFSRLYLGVHYLSDVWGGYLVGAMWLIVGISIVEWLQSTVKKERTYKISLIKLRIISMMLIMVAIAFYTAFATRHQPQLISPVSFQNQIRVEDISDIFSEGHLKFTETVSGRKQEPISFIVLAKNDKEFVSMLTGAGWFLADKASVLSIAKTAKAVLLKESYAQAPMTPMFWNKQTHNFGFQRPTNSNNIRERHHARFWSTNFKTNDGYNIYVGIASLDIGIKWGITHRIDADVDTEREFLLASILKANNKIIFKKEKFVKPVLGQNFSGDLFFTDGQIYLIKF